jgi:hypothetical protein
MLRANSRDVTGMAIVFWHGTITSDKDIADLQRAIARKLAKDDAILDVSEVETLGSGTGAVLVCAVRYHRPARHAGAGEAAPAASRPVRDFGEILPEAQGDSFPRAAEAFDGVTPYGVTSLGDL